MTGLALLERGTFYAEELPFRQACDKIAGNCHHWRAALTIGWERYDLRPDTHKKTRQLDAVEIIGVARYLATASGCRILTPASPRTPDKADQAALKALGWWVPGKDDAQSAACHLYRWLLANDALPPEYRRMLADARQGRVGLSTHKGDDHGQLRERLPARCDPPLGV